MSLLKNTGKLAGRTLFITGASRGIGKSIALKAAQDGANIVIAAKTTQPHPKLPGTIYTAAEEIESVGGQCLPCVVDIREEDQVQAAVEAAVKKFGGIDILVNNASAINLTGTLETSMKRYDLMMNVNARGTFLTSKLCLPYLLKSSNPHILNISPPLNMNPYWFKSHCAYTMAKYGMSICVLGMAEEFKADGVAVNALWPRTAIATAAIEMLLGDDGITGSRKPEIMADAAYALLTKGSKEATGQFFIDDEVLKREGITDFEQYANVPGSDILPDFFLDEAMSFADGKQAQGKPSADSSPPSSDTPAGVFKTIEPLLSSDVVKSVGASYLFILSGDNEGNWFLDLKNGEGSVGVAPDGFTADVTFKMKSNHMVEMFRGKLAPTIAFMTGKMKISGDFGKATKLEKLMSQVKSKL